MIYVVVYKNRAGRTDFLPNFYNGMARHTAKSEAEYTRRKYSERNPEAAVMEFPNLADANNWLTAAKTGELAA